MALIALVLVPILGALPVSPAPAAAQETPSGDVIVVLNESSFPPQVQQLLSSMPVSVIFSNVFTGFAANLTEAQVTALLQSNFVAAIYPNVPVSVAATESTGVRRIGAPSASATGIPPETNATVAVIDTGVQLGHPNLNVVGGFDAYSAATFGSGVNCGALTPQQAAVYEGNGGATWGSSSNHEHGTHVAGIIGARGADDVIGVAPGAGILAVRALDQSGSGTTASVICGIDWVIANRGRYGGIDVINMSVQSTATAGACSSDPRHQAICAATNAGLPVVGATGNGNSSSPPSLGAYDEVIAVSAFSDYDGLPGGLAGPPAGGCGSGRPDDHVAPYSISHGADIMAPGSCILSTSTGSGYVLRSGTSMAAAHAAGAVALLAAGSPSPSPAAARAYLLSNSVPQSDPAGLVVSGVRNGEPVLMLGDIPDPDPTATPSPDPTSISIVRSFQSNGASSATVTYDGNMSTIWTSASGAPSTAFFTLDLGDVEAIGTLRWVYGSGHGGLADAWQIQLSNDNQNWVTIRNRGNASPINWQEQEINRNARYIRFAYTNPNGDNRLGGVAEVEVMPADGPTTDLPSPTPTPTVTATPTPTATATPTQTPVPSGPYTITNAGRSSGSGHPLQAYDGSMSTIWVTHTSSVPSSAYIYFSLGSPQPIGSVRWVFGSGHGGLADYWEVQVSNDRANWTTVAVRGNARPGDWKEQAVNMEATYVRFMFSNPNGDARLGGIAEVQILPGTGGTAPGDTTPTATATATPTATATATPAGAYSFSMGSRSSGSTHPSLVYDGNPTTEWITTSSSVPSSAYVYVSFGGVQPIGEIRWIFATGGFADSYEIQISNDRQNWTTVATRSNAPVGEWQALAVGQDGHYVRFLFSNPNGTAKLGGIGEIEVYPPGETSVASVGDGTGMSTATATETASGTETATPAETATEAPPVTETVVPTETATEEPTETATTEPTMTEEPSPTETATEPPAEPTETVTEEAPAEIAAVETEIATEEPTEEAPVWTPGPGIWVVDWSTSELSAEGWTVLDQDPLTDWRTYPGTALPEAELQVDLGAVTWVTEVWWLVAIDAPGGRMVVESSLDGESWQVIGERPGLGDPGAWTSMPVGVEAQYIRIRFVNDVGQDQLGGIAEIVLLP